MSSLSKKIYIFLIFSILCNLTTSDDLKDCMDNVHEVFQALNDPHKNFEIALSALSETLLSSIYTSNELYEHFNEHDEVVDNIGNGIISLKHKQTLSYLKYQISVKEAVANWPKYRDAVFAKLDMTSIEDSSSSIGDSSSSIGEGSSSKQAHILGYFRSFSKEIKDNASNIDRIISSPKKFCEDHADNYEETICHQALYTMLNLRDFPTQIDNLMAVSGSEALEICFLNHTYIDFTTNTFFPQSDDSSSNENDLINIMIEYFNHLLEESKNIKEINQKRGRIGHQKVGGLRKHRFVLPGELYQDPPIFYTVQEYCEIEVENQ